jgi:dihydroxyacid dehydratase/phosphogluconate dehydratase
MHAQMNGASDRPPPPSPWKQQWRHARTPQPFTRNPAPTKPAPTNIWAQVGISSMWYEGNPCNMHLLDLAEEVKRGVVSGRCGHSRLGRQRLPQQQRQR